MQNRAADFWQSGSFRAGENDMKQKSSFLVEMVTSFTKAAAGAALLVFVVKMSGTSAPAGSLAEGKKTHQSPPPTCQNHYRFCRDNEEVLGKFSRVPFAQVKCRIVAESHIQSAKPDWPRFAFGTCSAGRDIVETGIADLIEGNVKIAGTGGKSRVVCRYDFKKEKVLSVAVNDEVVASDQ